MKQTIIIMTVIGLALTNIGFSQVGGNIFEIASEVNGASKTPAEKSREEVRMEGFKKGLDAYSKGLMNSSLNDKPVEVRCLYIMSDHIEKLVKSQKDVEYVLDCKPKKELLEHQALLVFSAGTLIFCPDELNSDKTEYAKAVLDYFDLAIRILGDFITKNNRLPTGDELRELTEGLNYDERTEIIEQYVLLDKFDKADEAFGNPIPSSVLLTRKIQEAKDLPKFYEKIIDYFTYFLSPQFMLKRGNEIDVLRKSLPCK